MTKNQTRLAGPMGSESCTKGRRTARRGVTVVEMAVVAPVVLFVLLGTFDLGIAVYAYNTMAEAARAGTRYAAVHGSQSSTKVGPTANDTTVANVVKSYAPGTVVADLAITSTWPDDDNNPGSDVTVTVVYTYRPAIAWLLGAKTLKLSSTSTMTIYH